MTSPPPACNRTGRRRRHCGSSDVASALSDYTQAVALDPADALAHQGRGRALLARGDLRGALDAFRAAVQLQPQLRDGILDEVRQQSERLNDPAKAAEWNRQAREAIGERGASTSR